MSLKNTYMELKASAAPRTKKKLIIKRSGKNKTLILILIMNAKISRRIMKLKQVLINAALHALITINSRGIIVLVIRVLLSNSTCTNEFIFEKKNQDVNPINI
jgi:hypothetical protein